MLKLCSCNVAHNPESFKMSASQHDPQIFSNMHPLKITDIRSSVERQRDHFMRQAAKWQLEYLAMKSERDHLASLLKMHHDSKIQISKELLS